MLLTIGGRGGSLATTGGSGGSRTLGGVVVSVVVVPVVSVVVSIVVSVLWWYYNSSSIVIAWRDGLLACAGGYSDCSDDDTGSLTTKISMKIIYNRVLLTGQSSWGCQPRTGDAEAVKAER